MIVSALLNLIYNILSLLLVFELPDLPESVVAVADSIIGYISTGFSILRTFVGSTCMGILAVLFVLVVAMNAAYLVYSIVFWVLRKIPLLGIEE